MTTKEPPQKMNGVSKIVRNATYMLGSQIMTWTMTIASIVVIPRYLGDEGFGEIAVAESVWIIGAVFALFGLDTLLVKSVARNPEKISSLFTTGVGNVLFNYILVFGGMIGFGLLSGYSTDRLQLIAIFAISSIAFSILSLAQAILTGLERLDSVSTVVTISRAIYTVIAISVLLLGGGLFQFAIFTVISSVIGAVLMVTTLYRISPFEFKYDFALAREFFREGRPYFLTLIFTRLYKEFDMVMMSWLVPNAAELGWYAAADKLFGTLMFLPNVLITALFPVLSRLHGEDSDLLPVYVSKSFNILILIGIPVGLGISAVAEPIILLFFGEEFLGAADILSVLGFVLILTYQTILLGYFLISIDKQRLWTITMAVAAAATIPLDLILVPYAQTFGPAGVGGAMAYIFTEGGMVIAGLAFLPKGYITRANLIFVLKAAMAGGLMYLAVHWFTPYGLIPGIVVGVVTYPAAIFLLRTIPAEDLELIQSLAAPITNRLGRFKK